MRPVMQEAIVNSQAFFSLGYHDCTASICLSVSQAYQCEMAHLPGFSPARRGVS